jgi:phosphoribosyl-ATP pyrophosphohydrolase
VAKSDNKRKRAKPAKPKATKAGRADAPKPSRAKAEHAKPRKRLTPKQLARALTAALPNRPAAPHASGPAAAVLDRLWSVIVSRRAADPAVSHSARLLQRGTAKVAQKLGEEAVECVIEAVAGNREAVIAESADVLYHLLVLWVSTDVSPDEVWAELTRREGVSGIAEKASRATQLQVAFGLETTKIP